MRIDLNDISLFSDLIVAFRFVTTSFVMKLAEIGLDLNMMMICGPSPNDTRHL